MNPWWLPPPCATPKAKKYRRRFSRLVNFLLSQALSDSRGVEYVITAISTHTNLGCRTLTKCWYAVDFDIGGDHPNAKNALHDIQMYAPRGLQRVTARFKVDEIDWGTSSSGSESSSDDHDTLRVVYVPNCQHNLRWKGRANIRNDLVPRVNQRVH